MCHLEPKPIRLCLGEHPTYSMLVVVRMGVFSNTSGSPALGPDDILISSVISEPGHPVAWWALNHVEGAHIDVGQVGGEWCSIVKNTLEAAHMHTDLLALSSSWMKMFY